MLTKAAIIWLKIPLKQYYCEILQVKQAVFYCNDVIYSCDAKLNIQHHYSSFQCHVILRKSF